LEQLAKPECFNIPSNGFLAKIFPFLESAKKIYSQTKFANDWFLSPYVLEACEYVNQYSQTSTCFC
jgi:hypothetical protein